MSHTPLSPCPGCHRHVRTDAPHCPFCSATLDATSLPVTPDAGGARLTRAALFAFATSVAACSTTRAPAPADNTQVQPAPAPAPAPAPTEPGTVAAIYGAPAPMMEPDAGAPPAVDAGTPAAPDAGPPTVADAGRPVRPRPPRPNPGMPMVRYGAPPPPDAFV